MKSEMNNHHDEGEENEADNDKEYGGNLEVDENSLSMPRPEEEREVHQSKDKRLQEQLNALKNELEQEKKIHAETTEDILHAENMKAGRDKYKTLKQIRSGNTKQRVDEFECM